ncbi:MAG: AraC family transcriptional regulator [Burkholderiales bacterium]
MTPRPMISATVTTGLNEAIAAAGANPDEVLRAVGLEASAIADPDAFIRASSFAQVLEQAVHATGDKDFGLHFGERFDPKDIGTLSYVVLNSPTVATASANIERYLHIHNEAARASFRIEGERGYLRFLVDASRKNLARQHTEYSMAVVVKTFQAIAGRQWKPLGIEFIHDIPAVTSEHLRVFGTRPAFGREVNAMIVEREFVERLIPSADRRLYGILKKHAERILQEMPPQDDFLATVRTAIAESMGEGDPTLARVGGKMATSARTLERRLKEHGTGYKQLVDDTRLRFALDYLKERRHTLTEMAFLLGYSEVSAFNRAFKRWTGLTPLEYRNKRRH